MTSSQALRSTTSHKAFKLKVLSYNIHKGFTIGNRQYVLSHIKEALQMVDADLIFLQEVLGDHDLSHARLSDWPNNSQFEYLADNLWPHFAYGKNAIFTDRHHGNAILSKYPFVHWDNIDITNRKLEPRGLLHGVIQLPHSDLHAICIHLDLTESGRKTQIKKLCTRLMEKIPSQSPLIIGGDFNDWTGTASKTLFQQTGLEEVFLKKHGHHARTFPVVLPTLRLDRIYCRGFRIKNSQCLRGVPWVSLSDHAALYAELDLPAT